MKTLDAMGNSHEWFVEQGRILQELPPNDAAVFHAAYWEHQHNGVPRASMHNRSQINPAARL